MMSKTFSKRDVFTCVNAENAKKYLGQEGYFAHSLDALRRQIKFDKHHKLLGISEDFFSCRFDYEEFNCDCTSQLFLPLCKIKEIEEQKELNYRPFRNIEEFLKYFKENDKLDFYNGFNKFSGIFVGYKQGGSEDTIIIATKNFQQENEIEINLNNINIMLSLQVKISGKWQPFGVLDEN